MSFQKLVLESFSRLKRGGLDVVLPEGERLRFGGLGKGMRAEVRVRAEGFWRRCVLYGPIGFAESYMEGEWETDDLVGVIVFFILNSEEAEALEKPGRRWTGAFNLLNVFNRLLHLRRPNSLRKARANIRDHYDLGNDFFRLWLDPTMTYSSAVFDPPELSLEAAQRAKYDRLCKKLELRAGERLLEIGSGWGGMSIHAAKHYGCRVTTLTISEEQQREAAERVAEAGLAGLVDVRLLDYRLVEGTFDKIVSIEMLEAVGDRYLETFFGKCHEVLKPRGLLALQMITCPDRQYPVLRDGVDFIQKHIFPGSLLLSLRRVNEAMWRTGDLNLHSWEDLGPHYARTLRCWSRNFEERIGEIRALGYDERFLRKWRYYFAYCEAAFGTRHISVVQAVFTRPDNLDLACPAYNLFDRP